MNALGAAGVDAILLKGAGLARMLYRSDESRAYFDVDLLVAPSDVTAAGRVLADLGYSNLRELHGIDDVAGILHADSWSRSVQGFGNVTIDLHGRLAGCEGPPEVAWSVLSARRAFIELAGHRVVTLDRSALALHLALHAAPTTAKCACARSTSSRATRRKRSTRLIGTSRATSVIPCSSASMLHWARSAARRGARPESSRRRARSKPSGTTTKRPGPATPRLTRSSRTSSETVTRASVRRAS